MVLSIKFLISTFYHQNILILHQIKKTIIMKNIVLFSAMMLLFVAGCSKDQRAVKILDGKWQLTKENGVSVDADYIEQVAFSNCKLKKDEYCNVNITITEPDFNFSFSGEYKVMDKGETLEFKFTIFGESSIERMKIKELTKTKLVIEVTEGSSVYTAEYKKI